MSGTSPLQELRLPSPPKHYRCPKVDRPVVMTGRMDDPLWERAPWTDDFIDILGEEAPRPYYRTRVKMLWDETCLMIGAELEDPHVWATLTQHDSVIFHDNDFEVFIDPDGDCQLYGELEVNAFNTTWDLLLVKPYRASGAAINGWEIAGLRTAVHVDGTINDPSDVDRGWSVEIAIPWDSLGELARNTLSPEPGATIRINFSRVQWEHEVVDGKYRRVPEKPEENWVWSAQGVVDMHRPHRWGVLQLCDETPRPCAEIAPEATTLMALYDAQSVYYSQTKRWASNFETLGLLPVEGVSIQATDRYCEMTCGPWHVDHDSRLWRE